MINIKQLSIEIVKVKSGRYPLNANLNNPDDVAKAFNEVLKMESQAEEIFCIIGLDTKNKIMGIFEVSRGTLNASLVHPREVFKRAITLNANSIIIAHNHPSGDTMPSPEDMKLTDRMVKAGDLLGIQVLDHIIIGDNGSYKSFKQSGLI